MFVWLDLDLRCAGYKRIDRLHVDWAVATSGLGRQQGLGHAAYELGMRHMECLDYKQIGHAAWGLGSVHLGWTGCSWAVQAPGGLLDG